MTTHISFSDGEKEYLRGLASRCGDLAKEHRKKAGCFKKVSYGVSIPLILTNVATLVLNAWGGDENDLEIKITTMCVLGVNAVSSGLKSYLKVDERIQYNVQKAISYEKLTEKIEISLAARNPLFDFTELAEEKINILDHDDGDITAAREEEPTLEPEPEYEPEPEPEPEPVRAPNTKNSIELEKPRKEPESTVALEVELEESVGSKHGPVPDESGQQEGAPEESSESSDISEEKGNIHYPDTPTPPRRQTHSKRYNDQEYILRQRRKFQKEEELKQQAEMSQNILKTLKTDFQTIKNSEL